MQDVFVIQTHLAGGIAARPPVHPPSVRCVWASNPNTEGGSAIAQPRKENRSCPIPTRFSEGEKDTLTQAATAAGVTLSDFIRAAALEQPLPPPRSKRANRPTVKDGDKLAALLLAVGRIGNNTNQLAHVANTGMWPESRLLHQAAADIQWMRHTLMQALGHRETATPQPDEPAP